MERLLSAGLLSAPDWDGVFRQSDVTRDLAPEFWFALQLTARLPRNWKAVPIRPALQAIGGTSYQKHSGYCRTKAEAPRGHHHRAFRERQRDERG
jgi:hypothetical protein